MCENTVRAAHQQFLDTSLYGLNAPLSKLANIGYEVQNHTNSDDSALTRDLR